MRLCDIFREDFLQNKSAKTLDVLHESQIRYCVGMKLFLILFSTNNFMLVEVLPVNSLILMKGCPSFLSLLPLQCHIEELSIQKSSTGFTKFASCKTKYLLLLQEVFSFVSLTMETTLHRKPACTGKLQSIFPCSLAYFIS